MSVVNEDVRVYFSDKEWTEMTEYEKINIVGKFKNYLRMKKAGKILLVMTFLSLYHKNLNLIALSRS